MSSFSKRQNSRGFTLIEVMIGLVLSAMLMAMVGMVLGQSITNNEVVRKKVGLSSRMFTLRRVLHRDLSSRVPGASFGATENGFEITTMNNHLLDSGVQVVVRWDFSGNMIRRYESSSRLKYERSFLLDRGLASCRIDVLSARNNAWVSLLQVQSQGLTGSSTYKAIRLNLGFDDGKSITLVERIPYAYE